ncbi:MAG: lipopolysaccharide biosynthesis protein [Armatimonadota bacterium]
MKEMTRSASTRAVRDTAQLLAARLASAAVSVFFSAWLIRLLPTEELAIWPIALALGGAIEALSSLGMGDTLLRRVPRELAAGDRAGVAALLKTAVGLNLIGCVIFTLLLYTQASWTAETLLRHVDKASLVRTAAFAAFFIALEARLSWTLKATQQFSRIAMLDLIMIVSRTPLAALLYLHMGLSGLLAAFAIVPAFGCIMTLIWTWPYMWASRRFESPLELTRFSLPFYGVSLTGFLRGRASYLVVGWLTTAEVLAMYFVASKVSDYIREFNRYAISAVTPKLSERGATDPEAQSRVFGACTRYVFLGLLPLHLGPAVLARPLVRLYAGSEYTAAATILAALCIYAYLEVLYDLHRAHIQVFAPPAHLFTLQLFSTAVDLGLMIALIRPFGALGAALAKVATYAVLTAAGAWALRRTIQLRYDTQALKWALIAGAGMSAAALGASQVVGGAAAGLAVGAAVGAVVYFILLSGRLRARDLDIVAGAMPATIRSNVVGASFGSFVRNWLIRGRLWGPTARTEDTVA